MLVLAICRGDGSHQGRDFPTLFLEKGMVIKVLSCQQLTRLTNPDCFRQVKSETGDFIEPVVAK
jgi:hypothetical protein